MCVLSLVSRGFLNLSGKQPSLYASGAAGARLFLAGFPLSSPVSSHTGTQTDYQPFLCLLFLSGLQSTVLSSSHPALQHAASSRAVLWGWAVGLPCVSAAVASSRAIRAHPEGGS